MDYGDKERTFDFNLKSQYLITHVDNTTNCNTITYQYVPYLQYIQIPTHMLSFYDPYPLTIDYGVDDVRA